MNSSWKMGLLAFCLFACPKACATLIAYDMFNNASLNLISYSNIYQAGFSNSDDSFKLYSPADYEHVPTILSDSSTSDPADDFGIISENLNTAFFGVSDTKNTDTADVNGLISAVWRFNIKNYINLNVSINMAAMGDFENADSFNFFYQFENSQKSNLFLSEVDNDMAQDYKLANGDVNNLNDPLLMNDFSGKQTLLNNYWQKMSANLKGEGQYLDIIFQAQTDGPEAFAFNELKIMGISQSDNFRATQVPNSSSALLFILALGLLLKTNWKFKDRRWSR